MYLYFIVGINQFDHYIIINATTDYDLFKRLMNRYVSLGNNFLYRYIDVYSLLENSALAE